MLRLLKIRGEQVLDLEEIACHRGSSFGAIGMPVHPSNEQIENEIAWTLRGFHSSKPIWVEDESRMIGKCKVPDALLGMMLKSEVYFVERAVEERVACFLKEYVAMGSDVLLECTERLLRKLGGARTKEVAARIRQGTLEDVIRIVLQYYDATYTYAMGRRRSVFHNIGKGSWSNEQWTDKLLSFGGG